MQTHAFYKADLYLNWDLVKKVDPTPKFAVFA